MPKDGSKPGETAFATMRRWMLPLLAAGLAGYVLWVGAGTEWPGQIGHYWFRLAPGGLRLRLEFIAVAAVAAATFRLGGPRFRRRLPAVLAVLLLGGQALFAGAALGVLRGGMPWGVDHPAFMFRLKEFGAVFPFALGSYNPWWNAGTEHFVGVTSGAHGFGLLIWPLLKFWEPHAFYGAALVFWFVFAFPWLGAASVRAAGVGWTGALCAGWLLCGASRAAFVWTWQYGTVGAMTSAMMAVPAVALGYRLAVRRRGGAGTALALAAAVWIMGLWTPGTLVGAGLALGWLWNARRWTWRSNRWFVGAGVLALALLAPWLWVTLVPCRSVVAYVGSGLPSAGGLELAKIGAGQLGRRILEWHPLLIFFGLAGTVVAAPRGVRRWTLPILLGLGAVSLSIAWNRNSQLDRMAIPMAAVAALPAAVLCGRLLRRAPGAWPRGRAWGWAAAQGVVVAALGLGLRTTHMHYANAGGIGMWPAPDSIRQFAEWIRAEVPEDGRLGFAGRAEQLYGWGKIAYLPILADREMMADDYYGFPLGTVEYDYPPAAYRRTPAGFLFFTEAYGITHWATAQPEAMRFFGAHPDRFERVKTKIIQQRQIKIYRVKAAPRASRFWQGAGRVAARENRLEVFPADPDAARVVIRYNWREGLACRTPGAAIEPQAVDENLRFIAIRPGGNERVEIGYRPRATPIPPNFDGYFHH
ncbi:MAG: hypothetical protein AB7V22_04065 [Kiritimatiellia bacterium]